MKKYINRDSIWLVIITIFFCSCERNVTVKLPDSKPKLVIRSINDAGLFSPVVNYLSVGKAIGILDTSNRNNQSWLNALVIKDASFLLLANGIVVDTLKFETAQSSYRQTKPFNGTVKSYTIKGGAPGYLPIEATTAIPDYIPVTIVEYKKEVRKKRNGAFVDEITIAFTDPGNEKNFYGIDFFVANFGGSFGRNCFYTRDKDIDDQGNGFDPFDDEEACFESVTLNDNNFNGTKKTIKFEVLSELMKPFKDTQTGVITFPQIILEHFTENHYKYIKSIAKYKDVRDNPFAEPVNIYTNIKNGYGIFTFQTSSLQEIK
jgi:hypothetical protein